MTELPDEDAVAAAARAAREADAERSRLAQTSAARDRELADLLEAAVRYRSGQLDGRCPVCGTEEVLDEGWVVHAEQHTAQLREQARALEAAERAAAVAREQLATIARTASALRRDADRGGLDTTALTAASEAWEQAWDRSRQAPDALAPALEQLMACARALLAGAAASRAAADEQWRPLAEQARSWRGDAAVHADGESATELRAAEAALGTVCEQLRAERIAPIADGARAIWAALSERSSVAFEDVGLVGKGNRRSARIDVRVDGVDSSALSVLSQGELNALALSLFLPRATLAESPFCFAVIDDPVQAMDPAKVDGLARVLHEHADNRQLVVFTHDTRLPEAVARLGLEARVIDVQRNSHSVVRLRAGRDLLTRYRDDARVCARDEKLDWAVRARVSLALCRSALDLGAERGIWRRRLAAGFAHEAIEQEIARCGPTLALIAALFKADPSEVTNPLRCVSDEYGPSAAATVRRVLDAAHGELDESLELRATVDAATRLAHTFAEKVGRT